MLIVMISSMVISVINNGNIKYDTINDDDDSTYKDVVTCVECSPDGIEMHLL